MTVHTLKTDPEPFEAIWQAKKKADVRSTQDRTFTVGDILVLREHIRPKNYYTGRSVRAVVLHIQPGDSYDLPGHLCVLSFRVCKRLVGNNHIATETNP